LDRPEGDQKLLAAPAHGFDPSSPDGGGESRRIVAAQRLGPVAAHAEDAGARNQAPQVAGNRLYFGQFRHI
jgi:hypothetical protein